MTSATALHIDSVSLTYRSRGQGEVTALEKMSLDVRDNEFITIVGQSGCGKSTLLRLVSGLLAPTTGSIDLADRPVTGPRSDVGIVFQSAVLLPWRTRWPVPLVASRSRVQRSALGKRAISRAR